METANKVVLGFLAVFFMACSLFSAFTAVMLSAHVWLWGVALITMVASIVGSYACSIILETRI